MFKDCAAFLPVFLLAFATQSAYAFFDQPYITPSTPTSGQTGSVNIHGGMCDVILGQSGYPQISQQGNTITVLHFGARNTNPLFCNFGVGTVTTSIGSFQAGSYAVKVDLRYINILGSFVVDTLGTVPFDVTAGVTPPNPIPTLQKLGSLLLVLVLTGCATMALRTRRTSHPVTANGLTGGVCRRLTARKASDLHKP